MADSRQDISEQVKRQMNRPQIHDAWEKNYRSPGNERFFEQAYDDFVRRIDQPPGSHALDIGCGICANSIRLARRGYVVSAADYSEPIIAQARENVSRHQLSDRVTIGREDILNLGFPTDHFDLVLCWGVLMHIPDAERAISQLVRVAKPGGFIVLEEVNQSAPEARMMRLAMVGTQKRHHRHEDPERLRTDQPLRRRDTILAACERRLVGHAIRSALLQPCSARQQYAL